MRMKMIVKKKKMLLVFMVLLLSAGAMQAQVRTGQKEYPRNGVILDLAGAYKGGLLLPRINIDEIVPKVETPRHSRKSGNLLPIVNN